MENNSWTKWLLLLIAVGIGFLPVSGPHLIFVMLFFFMNRPKEDEDEEIITTKDMLKDVNEERRNAGLYEIPEMNTRVNTGNLARMDKSFKSVPDFFRQLLKKKD